jgi:long-subunit fatty acid transport protein
VYRHILLAAITVTATAVLLPERVAAGGLYLNEAGTGAGNPANHSTASTAWLNPAGMTGVRKSSVDASFGLLVPWVKFDASVAEAGDSDGNNAGSLAGLPTIYGVKKLSDKQVGDTVELMS